MIDLKQEPTDNDHLRRSWQIQSVLYDCVRLLLEDISLEEALNRVIDRITSVRWLALESRGGVFLVGEGNPGVLVLAAQRGLPLPLQSMCAQVPFGRCLCGRVAASGKPEFADCVDDRHQNRWPGMSDHGHYCLPIKSGDRVLGVVYLHLKPGHRRDEGEEEFLLVVADLLSGIITRKQLEEDLAKRSAALEQKARELSGLNHLFQEYLAMRDERAAAYERLVQDIHRLAQEASKLIEETRRLEPPEPARQDLRF